MEPILKAIRMKREGAPSIKSGGMDLDAIVSQLSEDDKMLLMEKLSSPGEAKEESISKGGMSPGEKMNLDKKIMEDDEEMLDEDTQDVDSDSIAMGMLDSRFKGESDGNPRNLSERVQMNMAKNLKGKGKI